MKDCPRCDGQGEYREADLELVKCQSCQGEGKISEPRMDKEYADEILFMKCPNCGFETTTPSDNTLVSTGGFTCPYDQTRMKAMAKYSKKSSLSKQNEVKNNNE